MDVLELLTSRMAGIGTVSCAGAEADDTREPGAARSSAQSNPAAPPPLAAAPLPVSCASAALSSPIAPPPLRRWCWQDPTVQLRDPQGRGQPPASCRLPPRAFRASRVCWASLSMRRRAALRDQASGGAAINLHPLPLAAHRPPPPLTHTCPTPHSSLPGPAHSCPPLLSLP